jgi:ribosomal-protein-alanine N-acetyltransferase
MAAFFKSLGLTSNAPVIDGNGIFLRMPRMNDFEEWSSLRGASREFLSPWEPVWPEDDLTRSAFRRRIRRY